MSRVQVLIAGVVVALLGAAALQAETMTVPFKGSGTGAITGEEVIGTTEVVLTATGEGNATHLGQYTRTEEMHLNPLTGSFTGTLTFTAADGDQVVCEFTGQFVSLTEAAGEYVITGGTGRFAGAAGSASFNASMTGETTFHFNFSGDISF